MYCWDGRQGCTVRMVGKDGTNRILGEDGIGRMPTHGAGRLADKDGIFW